MTFPFTLNEVAWKKEGKSNYISAATKYIRENTYEEMPVLQRIGNYLQHCTIMSEWSFKQAQPESF
jgi:hypothetical protein